MGPSGPFLPANALMTEVEIVRADQLPQYLQRFNQPRTWSIEILVAVGETDTARFDRAKFLPIGSSRKSGHFTAGAGDVESAGHHHDDLRIVFGHGLPVQPRRMPARLAEKVQAARQFDQFRHPVACGHEWVEPLDAGD